MNFADLFLLILLRVAASVNGVVSLLYNSLRLLEAAITMIVDCSVDLVVRSSLKR